MSKFHILLWLNYTPRVPNLMITRRGAVQYIVWIAAYISLSSISKFA